VVLPSLRGIAEFFLGDGCYLLCRLYREITLNVPDDLEECPRIFSPVLSCPILCYPVLSYPVLSCPILSCPFLSYPILSYLILSYLVFFVSRTTPALHCAAAPHHIKPHN
jgi:hypothetical protein